MLCCGLREGLGVTCVAPEGGLSEARGGPLAPGASQHSRVTPAAHSSPRLLVWEPCRGRRGHAPRDALCHQRPPRPPAGNPTHGAVLGALKAPPFPGAPLRAPQCGQLWGAASILSVPSGHGARPQGGRGAGRPWREGVGTRGNTPWKSGVPARTQDRGAGVPAVAHPVPVSRGSRPSSCLSQASLTGEGQTCGRGVGAPLSWWLLLTPGTPPDPAGGPVAGGPQPSPSLSPQGQGHPPAAPQRVRAQAGQAGLPGAAAAEGQIRGAASPLGLHFNFISLMKRQDQSG